MRKSNLCPICANCYVSWAVMGFHYIVVPRVAKDQAGIKVREVWLKRLHLVGQKITNNIRVCNAHFVLGKPFYYTGETHPDWAPSLNFDKVYVYAKSAMDRESRRVILNVQRAFQEMVQDPEQVPIENVHLNEEVVNISLTEGHEELFPPLCTEAE
ncbi:hypothetical protein OUZ56_005163 [Daphnia magna]|uniref:THAP-type domain-containing protein n=1 Tax=Daphnia magna TaxID=35525 RepID=A0ABQ9YRZ9_9CRUS|nr:hypothetical protein OUZ56_005159 [Daphnia magna]KAK4003396.1 hypothetical protein OUZ56_005163 [Daphnia magna]